MHGLGTIVNVAAIVVGGLAGLLGGRRIPERLQKTLMSAMGVSVLFVGVSGTLSQMLRAEGGALTVQGTMMMTLSLPGERIGFLAIHPELTDYARVRAAIYGAGRALGYINASTMFQLVAAECVGQTADISVYKQNRDLIHTALLDMGYTCVKPSGAFYLFLKTPEPDATAFCKKAMALDLLVVPGDEFGCPGYVRLAYCVPKTMLERSLPRFRQLADQYGLKK